MAIGAQLSSDGNSLITSFLLDPADIVTSKDENLKQKRDFDKVRKQLDDNTKEMEKLSKKMKDTLNMVFQAMADYNLNGEAPSKAAYMYQNRHVPEMTNGDWEDYEYEHYEPTVTIRPMRKELKKLMTKFNAAHKKINNIKSQMRSEESFKEKEQKRAKDEEERYDSTCMICYKYFEVGANRNSSSHFC